MTDLFPDSMPKPRPVQQCDHVRDGSRCCCEGRVNYEDASGRRIYLCGQHRPDIWMQNRCGAVADQEARLDALRAEVRAATEQLKTWTRIEGGK